MSYTASKSNQETDRNSLNEPITEADSLRPNYKWTSEQQMSEYKPFFLLYHFSLLTEIVFWLVYNEKHVIDALKSR